MSFCPSPVSTVRLLVALAQMAAVSDTTPPSPPAVIVAAPAPEAVAADTRLSPARLSQLSASKFGVPYGHDGAVHPRRYDCQTYVEHVMAMALSPSPQQFGQTLDRLRYRDGVVKEVERYVYPIPDWIDGRWPAHDVTKQVMAQRAAPVMSKIIDRARFFRRYDLAHRGGYFAPERVDTPYIPLTEAAGLSYPDGSIAVFVQRRPGIVAAHCGFLFVRNGVTYLRHASQTRHAVIQEPLAAFVQRAPAYMIGLKVLKPDASGWQ